MKRELRAFVDELSRVKPLVLFIDDLHWADASTVDLLAYLCSQFGAMRLLLLVTYRPTDLQPRSSAPQRMRSGRSTPTR